MSHTEESSNKTRLCPVKSKCKRCIPDAPMGRDAFHVHLLLCHPQKTIIQKDPNTHSSTIYNSQDVGAPRCSLTDEWINKLWYIYKASWWLSGKRLCLQCWRHRRCEFNPWVRKIPWSRKWEPIPVFLPGKSHGQRNLAGYSVHGVAKSRTQLSDLNTHHDRGANYHYDGNHITIYKHIKIACTP